MNSDKRQTDYFSVENLSELADLESHIDFAESLIDKYQWDDSVKEEFTVLFKRIKDKQKDKKLNLSVIGEFSTGKSTFINAMLRTELLASSALQGTTAASTVIEYSDQYGMVVQYEGGESVSFQFDNVEELKEKLWEFTTEQETPNPGLSPVYNISVLLPSPSLAEGFRLIDTPGTNALKAWHEEVTVRTIQEISDVSIILINAIQPLPESICRFVEENLSSILGQCVFVVTKYDMLPQKEREGVLSYIRSKLEQGFGLGNALVLPYIAPEVINSFQPGTFSNHNSDDLELSLESERTIFLHMGRQRAITQTKKLISLIDTMYARIPEQMKKISEVYESELEVLLRTQQTDLSVFVNEQKNKRVQAYSIAMKEARSDITNILYELSGSAQNYIYSKIDEQVNLDELKNYTGSRMGKDCEELAVSMFDYVKQQSGSIIQKFQEEMAVFGQEFKNLYSSLNILEIDILQEKYNLPAEVKAPTADLRLAADYIAEELSKENKMFGGGAAAGAVVGTAIAPGVGTIIGLVAGAVGGGFFAPSADIVKKSAKEKMSAPLREYFNNAMDRAAAALNNYVDSIERCIPEEIDRYLTTYQKIVSERIDKEKKRRSEIEVQIQAIQADMDRIEGRRFALDSINTKLNSMNGGKYES